MFTCYYYYLIEPVRETLTDDANTILGFEIPVKTGWGNMTVAFIQYPDLQPLALRFKIEGLQDQVVPEAVSKLIQLHKEHFLSIYKLFYELDGRLWPAPLWCFREDGLPPSMNMRIKQLFNPPNGERLRGTYLSGFGVREQLKLYTDGQDPMVPLQFRFLSLFKIYEYRFRPKGKWQRSTASTFLEPYRESFQKLGHKKFPFRVLIEIRDRCAHINLRGQSIGVTHLNHADTKVVEEILPVLSEIAVKIINSEDPEKFQITKPPASPPKIG